MPSEPQSFEEWWDKYDYLPSAYEPEFREAFTDGQRAASADKERLDWLENNGTSPMEQTNAGWRYGGAVIDRCYSTLREAVDAARAEEESDSE